MDKIVRLEIDGEPPIQVVSGVTEPVEPMYADYIKKIVEITKNGEMAPVIWYLCERWGGTYFEVNGRYVIMVSYVKE